MQVQATKAQSERIPHRAGPLAKNTTTQNTIQIKIADIRILEPERARGSKSRGGRATYEKYPRTNPPLEPAETQVTGKRRSRSRTYELSSLNEPRGLESGGWRAAYGRCPRTNPPLKVDRAIGVPVRFRIGGAGVGKGTGADPGKRQQRGAGRPTRSRDVAGRRDAMQYIARGERRDVRPADIIARDPNSSLQFLGVHLVERLSIGGTAIARASPSTQIRRQSRGAPPRRTHAPADPGKGTDRAGQNSCQHTVSEQQAHEEATLQTIARRRGRSTAAAAEIIASERARGRTVARPVRSARSCTYWGLVRVTSAALARRGMSMRAHDRIVPRCREAYHRQDAFSPGTAITRSGQTGQGHGGQAHGRNIGLPRNSPWTTVAGFKIWNPSGARTSEMRDGRAAELRGMSARTTSGWKVSDQQQTYQEDMIGMLADLSVDDEPRNEARRENMVLLLLLVPESILQNWCC
ncbi:hypothetical protein BKA93DRAFT_882483 [Sparassis latifolia]